MTSKPFGAGIKCLVYSADDLQFKLPPLPFGNDFSGCWVCLESHYVDYSQLVMPKC
jgi:hypothetical protein